MENSLSILISSIILDLVLSLSIKKAFNLKVSYFILAVLQFICIMPTILYMFLPISIVAFILIKLLMWLIFTMLISDSFYFKDLLGLWFAIIILMFSIYGFAAFLVMFAKAVVLSIFGINIGRMYDFLVIIGFILYFVFIYAFVSHFAKIKNLKNLLAKVSFSLLGKHIEITGLLDSGNTLYDNKTGKAVVVVSVSAFKKVMPKEDYKNLLYGDFSKVNASHFIKYVSVGGKTDKMPVIDVGSVCVKMNAKSTNFRCVVGIVLAEFDTGRKVECLLHSSLIQEG